MKFVLANTQTLWAVGRVVVLVEGTVTEKARGMKRLLLNLVTSLTGHLTGKTEGFSFYWPSIRIGGLLPSGEQWGSGDCQGIPVRRRLVFASQDQCRFVRTLNLDGKQ